MEVHHHAHTASPPAGRAGKKWTHYFWEFLMLFLAVFCGFMAENQREHYIEKIRAKDYARALIHDLENDTTQLSEISKQVKDLVDKYDRFLNVSKDSKRADPAQLYYYGSFASGMSDFTSNVSTLDQIKNSGSLRYFDAALQDKISEYARLVDRNKDYKPFGISIHNRSVDLWNRIFDAALIDSARQWKWQQEAVDAFLITKPQLINNDPNLLKEFSNMLVGKKRSELSMELVYYKPALRQATELISLLKEEYQLK
jgi:hypothetical protein